MQRRRKSFLALAVTASLLLGASIAVTPAQAAQTPYTFTGMLFIGDAVITDSLNVRSFTGTESVSGTFTLENTIPDSSPSNTAFGRYTNAVTAFTINIGGGPDVATLGNAGLNRIEIADNGINDTYLMRTPLTGPTVLLNPLNWGEGSEAVPVRFDFNTAHFPSAFSSDAFAPPTLSNLNGAPIFRVFFDSDVGQLSLSGVMSTIGLAPIPLPPAVILFGAGLVALIGLGARNWQLKGNSVA